MLGIFIGIAVLAVILLSVMVDPIPIEFLPDRVKFSIPTSPIQLIQIPMLCNINEVMLLICMLVIAISFETHNSKLVKPNDLTFVYNMMCFFLER